MTGGKVKDIVSKEKSSNQILDLRYKDEAGGRESLCEFVLGVWRVLR